MEKREEAQPDPLLELTHGALRLSHASSAASMHRDRLVNDGQVKTQPNMPSHIPNSAQRRTDFHENGKDVDNGMLEAQEPPHSDSMDGAPKETAYHNVDRGGKQRKSAFQNTLENFTPIWFTIPMNTGILGILMHQLPYQFHGLPVLSTIMYLADLTFFVLICAMTILRWTLYPKATQRKAATSIDEVSYLSTAPIAFLTLTSLTTQIISNAS